MLAVSLAGVWAASRPAVYEYRWVPKAPAIAEHFFLVVSKAPDGSLRAFIRNPEYNYGASLGTRPLSSFGPVVNANGALVLQKLPATERTLRFHRLTSADARWFYPLKSATWTYAKPAAMSDGWRVGTLRDAGMRIAPLADFMNRIASLRAPRLRSPYIQSIAIARHGTLVLDQYFYGFTAQQPHDVRSAGKSVTTLLVGRAIDDTKRFTPKSHVLQVLKAYQPVKHDDASKQRMSVVNLMTMASGLACDDNDDASPGNEDTMQSQPRGTDWYRYTLDLPMATEPGTRAVYCTAGINLLGAIVQTETRMPLDRYFAQRFAGPMRFGSYAMWLMPPPANSAYMGGGDYFRPRDFLKFGELMLNGGRWHNRQIVDSQWIAESTKPRTAPVGEGDRYGYGWHLTEVNVNGRTYRVINAGGNGGQLLIIVPALDLDIMLTAGNYNQFPVWRKFLPEAVTAAVRSCRDS